MEIIEFKNINNVLVSDNEIAYNPEEHIAVVENGVSYEKSFRVGTYEIYNQKINYKILAPFYDNEVSNYILEKKGILLSIDYDFDKVMREEKIENVLGVTRIIRINFQIKNITNGIDCKICEC